MDWFFWIGPVLACLRILGVGIILGVLLVSSHGLGVGDAAFISAELVFCFFAVANASVLRSVDRSWRGLLIPILYWVSSLLAPVGSSHWLSQLSLCLWCVPRWIAISNLGTSCTAGVPTFVDLRCDGLFRVVRHPLDMSGVLARIGFAFAHLCWWNSFVAVGGVVITVWIVVIEEKFLRTKPEWCEYARWVRWRLFPGVW